jgi:hypothetical protein
MLTAIAALLALNLADRATTPGGSLAGVATQAHAGPPEGGETLVSAAQQRKMMITELKSLSDRVDRLDKTVRAGISVKVTEMPKVRIEGAQSN